MTSSFKIRPATRQDTSLILFFIKELAVYEKLLSEVVATEASLEHWIFNQEKAEVIIAEENGKAVGFALYFHNFSTFRGRAGLYLEDIYIQPEHRKKGYGKALFQYLANLAISRGCGRFEWVCLDWNQPSINFYLSMGAVPMSDWTVYRLEGEKLSALAKEKQLC